MSKRIKLADRELPTYSKGEEIFNMVSHIVGGALGIAALVLCIITAAKAHSAIGIRIPQFFKKYLPGQNNLRIFR